MVCSTTCVEDNSCNRHPPLAAWHARVYTTATCTLFMAAHCRAPGTPGPLLSAGVVHCATHSDSTLLHSARPRRAECLRWVQFSHLCSCRLLKHSPAVNGSRRSLLDCMKHLKCCGPVVALDPPPMLSGVLPHRASCRCQYSADSRLRCYQLSTRPMHTCTKPRSEHTT